MNLLPSIGYHCNQTVRLSALAFLVHSQRNKMTALLNPMKAVRQSRESSGTEGWYRNLPLKFGVRADDVTVITEPYDMYTAMLDLIQTSTKRIGLAALYLGNGRLETNLVTHIQDALESRPKLKAAILLDHCRGSRGENNSRTMLLPCLRKYPNQLTLSLYHTPNLKGIMKTVLPDRFNELLGLQHIKAYIFDDTLLLSGANLSNDYFTNRQDRCIVIKNCPELCDFFYSLLQVVSEFSYQVNSNNEARLHKKCVGDPTKWFESNKFIEYASSRITDFLATHNTNLDCCSNPDTWIYPIIQMGSFNINQEREALNGLLSTASASDRHFIATAYFNPSEEYIDRITREPSGEYHLVTASPQANGFTPATGIMRFIPVAYRWYETCFLRKVFSSAQNHRIKLYEYSRDQWTFHSKGWWFYPQQQSLPSMTIIGSSNYGYRSIHLDLEAQVVLRTQSPALQQQLHQEKENIYSRSAAVNSDMLESFAKSAPLWTQIVARLCRYYF